MKDLIFICLLLAVAHGGLAQTGNIVVTIANLKSSTGDLNASLYNAADGFPSKPDKAVKLMKTKIKDKQCTFTFADLPFGTYAISIHHDENGNGKMDTNFLGIPKEGYGASNDAKGTLGPPKFEDAKFTLNQPEKRLTIKIQ